MKLFKFFIFCFAAAVVLPLHSANPFLGNSRPPRSINIGKKTIFTLKAGDKNAAEIVLAPQASKMTAFAASELQSLLAEKLGVKYPIVKAPTAGKVSIFVGISKYSKAAGIDTSKLCRDAFIIKTKGKQIYILGIDDPNFNQQRYINKVNGWAFKYEKGTLFGVYDFLERIADARFFFAGGGTIIDKGDMNVPEINIYDRPDFEARQVQPYNGKHFLADTPGKGVVERNLDTLRMRWQTNYVPCCHGLGNLGYWARFGKSNPEFFAMDNRGKRVNGPRQGVWMPHYCFSSKVTEELYQDAKSCLLNEPASKRGIRMLENKEKTLAWSPTAQRPGSVFCAMPGDSFFRCQCEKCKPHMKSPREISDFLWGFVFDLAERLQKENIPGIVTNMSYSPYQLIPRNRKMPSNVYVMIATSGPWKNRYADAQKKDMQLIADWVEYGKKNIWLWNYVNKFANAFAGVPHSTPKAVGSFYKAASPKIFGAFMESETDLYQFNLLNYYVFSKVAWNNQTDVEALLQDYCKRMFGPAAAPMRSFIDRLEYLWMNKLMKDPINTDLGPVFTKASDLECWSRIYSAAERRNLTAMFTKAEQLAAKTPAYLKRVKLFRKLFLEEILRHGSVYDQQIAVIPRFTAEGAVAGAADKITVDGELNEKIWSKGGVYLQCIMGKGTDKSKVMFAKDSKYLYVAFDFAEPEMAKISAPNRKAGDSNVWRDNGIELFINPDCSRKNYYQLIMNSSENILTYFRPQSYVSVSKPWKPDIKRVVKKDAKSWRGEIRIALKDLNAGKADKMVLNVTRNQVRTGMEQKFYSWSPYLNRSLISMFHDPNNFGTIIFDGVKKSNLLSDGDFSLPRRSQSLFSGKWFTSWKLPQGVKILYDNDTFVSGFRSIALESTGKTISLRHNLEFLKPKTKYKVSFFVKLENVVPKGRFSGVVLNVASGRNLWFPNTWLTGTTPWTYHEGVFISGDKPASSYMLLYMMNSSGKAWFDNVRLEEVK